MNAWKRTGICKPWSTLLAVGAFAVIGIAGCTDKNNNGQPDGVSQPAVDKAVSQVENTAKDVAAKAEPAVENAVSTAEDVTQNGIITGKIKTAYISNDSLKARNINVTTDSAKKTVLLQGTVQNAAQKNLATKIAQQNAPGFKIANQLKVAGGASPKMNPKAVPAKQH
jgi:osmotically-inducible protein OsmY